MWNNLYSNCWQKNIYPSRSNCYWKHKIASNTMVKKAQHCIILRDCLLYCHNKYVLLPRDKGRVSLFCTKLFIYINFGKKRLYMDKNKCLKWHWSVFIKNPIIIWHGVFASLLTLIFLKKGHSYNKIPKTKVIILNPPFVSFNWHVIRFSESITF